MKWQYNVEYNNGKVLSKQFATATEMWAFANKVTEFCRNKYFLTEGVAQIRRTWFCRG